MAGVAERDAMTVDQDERAVARARAEAVDRRCKVRAADEAALRHLSAVADARHHAQDVLRGRSVGILDRLPANAGNRRTDGSDAAEAGAGHQDFLDSCVGLALLRTHLACADARPARKAN